MAHYHLEQLDRKAYRQSIAEIEHKQSASFANLALKWWDRHFSWKAHGCVVLVDDAGDHLSYIFYKIDRYKEYITIHNLFTPFAYRRKGYAHELLRRVFTLACDEHVGRFRLASVPQSLDFYLSLGFVYWGLNTQGDYYCDLPLPKKGLDAVKQMVQTTSNSDLSGNRRGAILAKVANNETLLSQAQQEGYKRDRIKLGKGYLYASLLAGGKDNEV